MRARNGLVAAALGVVLASGGVVVRAEPPATATAASTQPMIDARPRLAAVGFEADKEGDPRDAWLASAFEEALTWRLRRVPTLITIPTIRLYQAQQELQDPNAPPPPWPTVVRGLGAGYLLSGHCNGPADAVMLQLTLARLDDPNANAERVIIPAGRVVEVLDQAVRWVLVRLSVSDLDEAVAKRIYAPPTRSLSALEYFAVATAAAHANRTRDALHYANEAVDSDRRFRSALGLLAQLELRLGSEGRNRAAGRLRIISDLARMDGDTLDRANAELALSLVAQADGASEAARTRAETALTLATESRDIYGQAAALAWLADVYLTWQSEAGAKPTEDEQQRQERARLQQAAEYQRTLLNMLEALNDRIAALPVASKLALILERLGESDAAMAMHQKTLEMAKALGSRRHAATAWLYLGQWYRNQKRWSDALDAMTQCLELADEVAKPAVHIALGALYQAMPAPEKALAEFEQAYQETRKSDDLPNQFTCLREMARVRRQLGQRKEAVAALQEALDIAQVLELPEKDKLRAELESWKEDKP